MSVSLRRPLNTWLLLLKTNRLWLLMTITTVLFVATDCFYVLLSWPLHTFFPSGDEPQYLVLSQTILKYHSLDIMQAFKHGDYLQFYPRHLKPDLTLNARGELLPVHNIGASILWLLPYALLGRLGAVLFVSLVSILIVANIYQLLRLMGIAERTAFLVSLAYAIASPLTIYAHMTFVEPLGAFICIYVLRKALQPKVTNGELVLCSLLLGLLPWIHIRFAQLEISLFCILLFKLYREHTLRVLKPYLAFLLPVGLLFLLLEVYTIIVWGSWNPALSQVSNNGGFFEIVPLQSIFLGQFFDQDYGLLFAAPVFLFLLIGLGLATWRRSLRAYNLSMLIICVPYIIIFTTFRVWFGGANPPVRYLLVLLPLACYYIAYAIEFLSRSRLARAWLFGSIGYGFLYNLASIAPPYNGFDAEKGFNVTLQSLNLIHLPVTDYLPSLFACKRGLFANCWPRESLLFALWITFFIIIALLMIIQNRKNTMPLLADQGS